MPLVYEHNLNHGRFEVRTETPKFEFLQVKQVHGTDIATPETLPAEADGIMVSWDEFSTPVAIKTADCLPIVIEGEKGAVCLHAGWRGLAQGILSRPEIDMINPQRVLIGPSIHDCCYEVSPDFKENFPKSEHFRKEGKQLYFNLQQEARMQLRSRFPNLLIEISPICTSCNPSFHSYRKNKTKERNWNLYIKG